MQNLLIFALLLDISKSSSPERELKIIIYLTFSVLASVLRMMQLQDYSIEIKISLFHNISYKSSFKKFLSIQKYFFLFCLYEHHVVKRNSGRAAKWKISANDRVDHGSRSF